MKKQLSQKEQWYADTEEEAAEIIADAKEDKALVMHKSTEKNNKYGKYHLVDLQFSYHTPRELMEDEAAKKEREAAGEKSSDEGTEYEVNGDGTVDVKNSDVAKKTRYFEDTETGDLVKVEKGESLAFLEDGDFDEITKAEYEEWSADNGEDE